MRCLPTGERLRILRAKGAAYSYDHTEEESGEVGWDRTEGPGRTLRVR